LQNYCCNYINTLLVFDTLARMTNRIKHSMQPARGVVDLLGGCRVVSRALGISPSTVSRWMAPKSRQNLGGRIPLAHWQALLDLAKREGKSLSIHQLAGMNVE
jgi:hypothetical protein